jgi:hypothetical protein
MLRTDRRVIRTSLTALVTDIIRRSRYGPELNSSSNNRNEEVISSRQKFMVLLLVVEGSRFGQNWTENVGST